MKLSYANITSTLALVLALGGTSAYAANTIGSSDIKNNSIRSVDIKAGQVKGSDLATGTVARAHTGASTINAGANTSKITLSDIQAPAKGQLQFSIMISCISSGTADTRWNLTPEVDGAESPGTTSGLVVFSHASDSLSGASVTLTGTATVAPGAHTVGFAAERSGGDGSLDCNIQTSSLWVPFNNNGTR